MAGSVLETFYLLFSSNSDEMKKGADDAKKSSDNLEESLSNTDAQSRQTGQGFLQLARRAAGALVSIAAVSKLATSTLDAARYAEDLRLASDAIGENIEDLDAWGRAVGRFGGTAQGMQATLTGLNNAIRETAFTGEGALTPVLNRLGLNLRDLEGEIKGPLQLLPEIAEAFESLDRAESNYLGAQLGLDRATISMLQQGRGEVERLIGAQRELGVITAEDAEAARLFRLQVAQTSDVFLSLRQRMATALLPSITAAVAGIGSIGAAVEQNQPLIEGLLIGVAGIVTAIYLPAMVKAAAATLAATWPILAIIGIVAALAAAFALVYDEVVNFARGNDSLIGEAVKRWPLLGYAIIGVANTLRQLLAIGRTVFTFLAELIRNPEAALDGLFESVDRGLVALLRMVPIIGGALSQLYAYFVENFGGIGAFIDRIAEAISFLEEKISPTKTLGKLADLVNSPLNDGGDNQDILRKARESLNLAATSPISAQTSTSIFNSSVRTSRPLSLNIDQLTISTRATDANGIGAAISASLTEQLQQAIYNFDDGVDA